MEHLGKMGTVVFSFVLLRIVKWLSPLQSWKNRSSDGEQPWGELQYHLTKGHVRASVFRTNKPIYKELLLAGIGHESSADVVTWAETGEHGWRVSAQSSVSPTAIIDTRAPVNRPEDQAVMMALPLLFPSILTTRKALMIALWSNCIEPFTCPVFQNAWVIWDWLLQAEV